MARELMRDLVGGTLLGLSASLLLAGCGDAQDSSPASSDAGQTAAGEHVDPCTLLTASEAEQVLGAPPGGDGPSVTSNEYISSCTYLTTREGRAVMLTVGLSRQNGAVMFDNAKRMDEEGMAVEPVSGIGEDAVWVGDLQTLYVLKSGTNLAVGGSIDLDQAKTIAARAVERLP